MKHIEYVFYLSAKQFDRLRVKFYKEKILILEFVVQYEAKISGEWQTIVRYDTRHNFAHRDLIYPNGKTVKSVLEWQDYNLALTYATEDLKQNWQIYRRNFEEKINEK